MGVWRMGVWRMVSGGHPCQHGGVQELPAGADSAALERRANRELSPVERVVQRRNRRWMTLVLVPSLLVGGAALVAALVADSGGSSVHPQVVPPGYRAVSDGLFAYAVPSTWAQSSAYTDNVGDLDTAGPAGWVAEHVDGRVNAPVAGEAPPGSFATCGESRPTPYHVGSATPTQVKGAAVAYRYTLTRPGGFAATAIDAWQSRSGAELWLLIRADAATTTAVLSSLNA
jgi:hypothetical protein